MRRIARIAICTLVGLLVLLFGYGLYSNLSQRMIRRSDVAAPSLRTILTGIIEYQHTYKTYPPTLLALGGSPSLTPNAEHAELIDDLLATDAKSGYSFRYKAIDTSRSGRFDAFTITADPLATEGTKQCHYFTDQTGVIRVEIGRPATAASPPLGPMPG